MQIVTIAPSQIDQAVDVLCDAFHDYPVMRFVIGEAGETYDHRLRALIGFFTAARFHQNDIVLGVRESNGTLIAAATITRPGNPQGSSGLEADRGRLWRELGDTARQRHARLGDIWKGFTTGRPQYHLNMIGVRGAFAGRGAARLLLDALHATVEADPKCEGVNLTTENPRNVTLYQHFGYRIAAHTVVEADLQTWGFFRPNPEP